MSGKEKLTHRIHTRVTKQKYDELSALLMRSSGIKSLCELLRNILENQKIMLYTHDNSLDVVMEKLSAIRTELNRIGVNINQLTGRFHAETQREKRALLALEVLEQYRQVGKKVDELLALISKISYKWLPG